MARLASLLLFGFMTKSMDLIRNVIKKKFKCGLTGSSGLSVSSKNHVLVGYQVPIMTATVNCEKFGEVHCFTFCVCGLNCLLAS